MKKFIFGFLISFIIFGSTTVLAANGELKALVSDFKIKLFGASVKTQSKILKVNDEFYIAVKDVSKLIGNGSKYEVNTKTKTIEFTQTPKSEIKVSDDSPNNYKIQIPDKALESIVRKTIGKAKGDIFYNDIKQVTAIYEEGKGIKSLEGLQHFKKLKQLQLSRSEIEDINVLSKMPQLEFLDLQGGKITDVTPLSALKNLKTLSLSKNNITDISALSGLSNLDSLYLTDNKITDISLLKNLKKLKYIDLSNNPIFDISALKGMKLESTSDLLVNGENSYYKLPYNNFAIKLNGKLYTMGDSPSYNSFFVDVNNNLHLGNVGLSIINYLLNLKVNGYTITESQNPFFDGVLLPSKWDNFFEVELKYSNATESYQVGKILSVDKSILFEYQIKKGDYKGVTAINDHTILIPFSEILNKAGISLKTEFDTSNKLIVFSLD